MLGAGFEATDTFGQFFGPTPAPVPDADTLRIQKMMVERFGPDRGQFDSIDTPPALRDVARRVLMRPDTWANTASGVNYRQYVSSGEEDS